MSQILKSKLSPLQSTLQFQKSVADRIELVSDELQVNFKWSSSDLQVIFKWTSSDLQVIFKWTSSELQVIFKWTSSELQVNFKWSSSELQVNFKWSSSELQVNPTGRTINTVRLLPFFQNSHFLNPSKNTQCHLLSTVKPRTSPTFCISATKIPEHREPLGLWKEYTAHLLPRE